MGAGAVAHDGATGRGVRHGAVRADAGRRAIGSIAGLVHQHVAGADEGSADGRGGEREGDACATGGIDASRACAAGAGAALQRGAGADAVVHVAAELSVQQAEGRGRAYCRRRRIARRARANQLPRQRGHRRSRRRFQDSCAGGCKRRSGARLRFPRGRADTVGRCAGARSARGAAAIGHPAGSGA
ncbi:putative aMP-dependent synthetase and ligase [Burkholderia pseudomallei]|nr:putative aMP-dependent synthetase and ligase [Burkholderia pseudomallei]